ncbi:DUF2845 domain-containing protein [Thioalkalivibrio thiocyanodenitrificans]|uniref:DUF2845 domain-containing protein n=1 Tax=Thioalkalivibrio thiocyanodenitrificans TaxID=243063 RepID=UPI0003647857|nr:DUF2845 domain-containing protein [Thioalkalivibrio thiocyanodenitrificans]
MKRLATALCLVAVAMLTGTAAAGLRCDGGLVSAGDRRFDVRAVCGEPDLRVPVREHLFGTYMVLPYEEVWFYNFGRRRFIQELRFRASRLASVQSHGYGFNPDAPGRCTPHALRQGMTLLELHARCGDPDDREMRVRWIRTFPEAPGHGSLALEQEWLYNFGPRDFYRVVTLVDGRITRVERGRRGH